MSAIIYHNPKCSKSRTTLAILKEKDVDFEIIEYLKNPPSVKQLTSLLSELNINARGLMRKNEVEYKEQNLNDKTLNESQLIEVMVNTPKLIQRPIVKTTKGVALGRPPENILNII